jgi:hypothetical protein
LLDQGADYELGGNFMLIEEALQRMGFETQHEPSLRSIVRDAVNFSRVLRCQPSCWSVILPGLLYAPLGPFASDSRVQEKSAPSIKFSAETMVEATGYDSQRHQGQKTVKFFLVPALYKNGMTGAEQVVLKAKVRTS